MNHPMHFAEVLEAVDRLSEEDQETLIEIVRRRMAERGRKRVAAEIREAEREFAQGGCQSTTIDDLMNEIRP